jgi:hypothetical protein
VWNSAVAIGLFGAALALTACEPATVADARSELGRGAARTVSLAIPISQDTFFAYQFLLASDSATDTVTTPGGLLAKVLPAESLASAVGQRLAFDGLTFQAFDFSGDSLLIADSVSGDVIVTFAPPGPPYYQLDTLRFTTPHGSPVVAATIGSGPVDARIENRTTCDVTVTETVTDSTGATVLTVPTTLVNAGATVTVPLSAEDRSFQGYVAMAAPTVTTVGACVIAEGETLAIHLGTTGLVLSSVSVRNFTETFSQSYALLAGEPRIHGVDTVLVHSGSFDFTARNRLPLAAQLTLTLDGVTRGGTTVTTAIAIPAAAGDGSYRSSTASVNLAGATIRPGAVTVSVSGTVSAASATITREATTHAEVVDGTGSLVLEAVAGHLDPTATPELNVALEEYREIRRSRLDFGDLQEAMKDVRLHDATGDLTIRNTAQAPLALSNVTLGVVQLDALGALRRDGLGRPVYERDSTTGLPILVTVAPAGQTRLNVPRAGSATLSVPMAPLVDRLVHLLLNDVRAAVVAAGTAVAGDGSQSRVTRNDSAVVRLQLSVGMDLSLPDSGIVFTRTAYASGASLSAEDSAGLASRLTAATVVTEVATRTPFAMTVDVAIVGDSVPSPADVFAVPDLVHLGPVTVAGSPVDAQGLGTTSATSSQTVRLTANDARPLLGRRFTTGVRIRLQSPPGGAGRGAIRPTDQVVVKSRASVVINAGGGQ